MKLNSVEHRHLRSVTDAPDRRGISIALQGLSKSYSGRQVLKSFDIRINAGEFVAVVGRSGCGKSTLLRLIAGLEQANAGRIDFEQNGLRHRPETRVMFQDSRLLPWKRVIDNVALGLPKQALDKAAESLEKVGLKERARDWPASLSGGQRQRVALARALVHDPELLLLDEPLGALDALTRIEMQQLIENLWLQRGFTALLVTHDVQEAIALADRVILVEDGQIALDERIDLPRPRARGHAAFSRLEERVLERVLRHPASDVGQDEPFNDFAWHRKFTQVSWAI